MNGVPDITKALAIAVPLSLSCTSNTRKWNGVASSVFSAPKPPTLSAAVERDQQVVLDNETPLSRKHPAAIPSYGLVGQFSERGI